MTSTSTPTPTHTRPATCNFTMHTAHYQARLYRAWYRHITLAMAALAYLTAIRTQEAIKGAKGTTSKTSCPSASRRSAD
ncbi:hypothetical protein FEF34_37460 [Streptomyces marianii]|uniref:Uncharacterized protein n=1 Tax=Streptomyces marianii TaxID=1817406 RepID=A0A5R9ECC8_9ACTN|nr:hypothetical protein FEF34_37460 [Streptomyces marianii]